MMSVTSENELIMRASMILGESVAEEARKNNISAKRDDSRRILIVKARH